MSKNPAGMQTPGRLVTPPTCSPGEEFWPSRLAVRAASRSGRKLRPLRSGRRENPIDKNSRRSPAVRLHSVCWSDPGQSPERCIWGARIRGLLLAGRDPEAWLPALSHRLFRVWLRSWAQRPRPLRAGGRPGSRDPPDRPVSRSGRSQLPPWPPDRRDRTALGPRSRDSGGRQGLWWGSWPWRLQQLPLPWRTMRLRWGRASVRFLSSGLLGDGGRGGMVEGDLKFAFGRGEEEQGEESQLWLWVTRLPQCVVSYSRDKCRQTLGLWDACWDLGSQSVPRSEMLLGCDVLNFWHVRRIPGSSSEFVIRTHRTLAWKEI
jgi:hypothetical protein